ncbi:hypothetical protein CARUB_v10022810mg, partial [Capsella rubella]
GFRYQTYSRRSGLNQQRASSSADHAAVFINLLLFRVGSLARDFEMSDSDMDIDDDEVEQKVQVHTIGGEPQLLHKPIQAPNPQNGNSFVHSNFEQAKIPSDEQAKFIKEQAFAQNNGTLSRFLHVKENSNFTSQQQAGNNMAGSSYIQSDLERRISDSKEGVRVSQLSGNGLTPFHTREHISFVNPPGPQRVVSSMSFVNPPGSQRVFPFNNEMRFMPSSENIGRESLKQMGGADFKDNRSLVINSSNPFTLRSSFVHDNRSSISSYLKTDMVSSGPAWTGSLPSSVTSVLMNEGVSNVGHFEKGSNICGSGSLPTLQEIAVSSEKGSEGNTTSSRKKVSSDDWEPSEPFKASFTIPPYILPSFDALYDPFTDIENLEDRSLNASFSSKGDHAQKNSLQQRDGDSGTGPQERECKNDDKSSSCSQNQRQESVARRSLEAHGVVEGVATSVVDQNDTTTPSKEISSAAAAENRVALKRSKPAGHDSWHRSDGSSYKKTLKADEIDGEVRSDAEIKVMRQFRTAVVETVKEMLKPLWREGRLTKEVHNMIVKKAAEKVVSGAVECHQVPTDTESVEQYLGFNATKMVKLVEGYVQKYGKP